MREEGVVEEMGVGDCDYEDGGEVWNLGLVNFGTLLCLGRRLTISPRRAMAGSSVGTASL